MAGSSTIRCKLCICNNPPSFCFETFDEDHQIKPALTENRLATATATAAAAAAAAAGANCACASRPVSQYKHS